MESEDPKDYVVCSAGAKRSERKPRFDLIQRDFLYGIAQVLTEGERKYGPNNWKNADQPFAVDAINHIIDHIYKWTNGDRSENHLLHAACGLMFVYHYNQEHPEWFLANPEPEAVDTLEDWTSCTSIVVNWKDI